MGRFCDVFEIRRLFVTWYAWIQLAEADSARFPGSQHPTCGRLTQNQGLQGAGRPVVVGTDSIADSEDWVP